MTKRKRCKVIKPPTIPFHKRSLMEKIAIPIYFSTFLVPFEIYMLFCCSRSLVNMFEMLYKPLDSTLTIVSGLKFFKNILQLSYIPSFYLPMLDHPTEIIYQMLWQMVRHQWKYVATNYAEKREKFECVCSEASLTTEYCMTNERNESKCQVGTTCITKFHKVLNIDLFVAEKVSRNLRINCIGCLTFIIVNVHLLPNNIKNVQTFKHDLKVGYVDKKDIMVMTCGNCIPNTLCTKCNENNVYKIDWNELRHDFVIDFDCVTCERCFENPLYSKQKIWKANGLCQECGSWKKSQYKTCFKCSDRHKCENCGKYILKKYSLCFSCK